MHISQQQMVEITIQNNETGHGIYLHQTSCVKNKKRSEMVRNKQVQGSVYTNQVYPW